MSQRSVRYSTKCAMSVILAMTLVAFAFWVTIKETRFEPEAAMKTPSEVADGFTATHPLSGSVFTGVPFRTYSGSRLFSPGWRERIGKNKLDWNTIVNKYYDKPNSFKTNNEPCNKWAVVTTIFDPNEAIAGVASQEGWCMVIVADNKTPLDYLEKDALKDVKRDSIFLFTVEEQKQWLKLPGELGNFVRNVPFNHFARKNLGFIYAVLRGAEFVYDFDDDNYIDKIPSGGGKLQKLIKNETHVERVKFLSVDTVNFNHHPLMGATVPGSWPRGFPLEHIQDTSTHGKIESRGNTLPMEKVGVLQYCANNNPDIDAVHRLVLPLPMNYEPESSSTPVLVPRDALVPYNAQATLHTRDAFFAMLLPITVKGRVTDIWRSYFAEILFRDLDLGLVFLPPRITQYRNPHQLIGDMNAERDLYFKAEKLSDFGVNWTSEKKTLPARMEQLWIDLYERGYIELQDVEMVQEWLGSLVQIGYKFRTPDLDLPSSETHN